MLPGASAAAAETADCSTLQDGGPLLLLSDEVKVNSSCCSWLKLLAMLLEAPALLLLLLSTGCSKGNSNAAVGDAEARVRAE